MDDFIRGARAKVARARRFVITGNMYHDANLIKPAVGIHFARLIYVRITALFSAEISRRS